MSHARLERQLSAYLDNELTPDDAHEVRAHLESCSICQQEIRRLRQVKHLLGALPERVPPAQIWDEVYERLEAPAPRAAGLLLDAVRAAFRRPVLAAAAAALVVLLIALPLVKGRIDRLRAAEIGPDLFLREHVLMVTDPFVDRAFVGLLVGDANLVLAGEPRERGEETR